LQLGHKKRGRRGVPSWVPPVGGRSASTLCRSGIAVRSPAAPGFVSLRHRSWRPGPAARRLADVGPFQADGNVANPSSIPGRRRRVFPSNTRARYGAGTQGETVRRPGARTGTTVLTSAAIRAKIANECGHRNGQRPSWSSPGTTPPPRPDASTGGPQNHPPAAQHVLVLPIIAHVRPVGRQIEDKTFSTHCPTPVDPKLPRPMWAASYE